MQISILTLLSFVQMCKFFSHFGIRTLLVLYLVDALGRSDGYAFGINALFCGLNELGAIFGGILADRYLGLRRGVFFGSLILAIGYLAFSFVDSFYLPLSLIIAGSCLFSSNILALLGLAYSENDPLRKHGFTIFYMMQNLGALVATLLCGYLVMLFSFQVGFLVASLGQCLGTVVLFLYRKTLISIGTQEVTKSDILRVFGLIGILVLMAILSLWAVTVIHLIMPIVTLAILFYFLFKLGKEGRLSKGEIYTLLVYLCALILFFSVEDQICSSLILFAQRATSHAIFGWVIPGSFITAINPIVILCCGAFVAKTKTRITTPFLMTALSFSVIGLLCLAHISCSILGIMGMVVLISFAELILAPLIFSYTSEMGAKGNPGRMMGLVAVAFSLAYQVSGLLSQTVAMEESSFSMQTYGVGFVLIACLMLFGGFIIKYSLRKISEKCAFYSEFK